MTDYDRKPWCLLPYVICQIMDAIVTRPEQRDSRTVCYHVQEHACAIHVVSRPFEWLAFTRAPFLRKDG